MIKPEELYEKTKIPADEKILEILIQLFLNIPFSELNYNDNMLLFFKARDEMLKISSEIYNQINASKKGLVDESKFNNEKEMFYEKIINEFKNAGSPFDPNLHNGATNPIKVQFGWYTVKSWNILGTEKIHNAEQVHRFYIPIASDYKFDYANELFEEFKKQNIPFYFKVGQSIDNRPDNIVIYTSSKLLAQTLNVLDNIEKRRPDLVEKCTDLSKIVGIVSNYIGYASEIPNINKSYTQIISSAFGDAIEETINEYMSKSIPIFAKQEYDNKIKEMINKGYKIEIGGRKAIAIESLLKTVPLFKKDILNRFRNNLSKMDIDLNNLCFNNKARKEIETLYGTVKKDILDPEVQNRVITLPDGRQMSISQYYKINNLEYWIPFEAKVTFKSGRTISGRDFLNEAFDRLEKYNSWEELVVRNGIMIERHPNVQQELKKDKRQAEPIIEEGKSEDEYQQRINEIHRQLFLGNEARQSFAEEEKLKALEQARKLIDEQMVNQNLSNDINGDYDMNYGSSGISR